MRTATAVNHAEDFSGDASKAKFDTTAAYSGGGGGTLAPHWFTVDIASAAAAASDAKLYERRVPYGNMPEAVVVNRILSGTRPKFTDTSDVPATVKRIIEACWSSSANERPMADKVAYILTDIWTHRAGIRRNFT